MTWARTAQTGQKAPSAKRCIKTPETKAEEASEECQKAPSAKRCIKTHLNAGIKAVDDESESTERQKVH